MANFEGTRSYLVGRKVLLERNLEKIKESKVTFEDECIDLMEKLETAMREGSAKFDSEISKTQLSIDLHQNMLVALDEDNEVSEVNTKTIKELKNLETVINLADNRVKRLFTEKQSGPQVVKRTIKPHIEVKAIIAEEIRSKEAVNVENQLFKKPFQYNPYPDEYYIRTNGFISNQFVGERLYEYMRDYNPVMNIKEMAEWVAEVFPESKTRWTSVEKGITNVLQLCLKRKDLVVPLGNGTYRAKEVTQ